MFFIQRNLGELIEKGKQKDVVLSEADRKVVITQVHAYTSLKFVRVEKHHIVQAAKTIVALMPSLMDKTDGEYGGFVSFFNEIIN